MGRPPGTLNATLFVCQPLWTNPDFIGLTAAPMAGCQLDSVVRNAGSSVHETWGGVDMPTKVVFLSLLLSLVLASGAFAGGGDGGDDDEKTEVEIIEDAIGKAGPNNPPPADEPTDVTEDFEKKWEKWRNQRNRRTEMAEFADQWSNAFHNFSN
jgi:hypothetical protein